MKKRLILINDNLVCQEEVCVRMRVWKSISLFIVYPLMMLCAGFLSGIVFMELRLRSSDRADFSGQSMVPNSLEAGLSAQGGTEPEETAESSDWQKISGSLVKAQEDQISLNASQEAAEAGFFTERLNADTDYVLRENDRDQNTVVETTWKLPAKYIGMDREQFLAAMEAYEMSPPLNELERGFVGLEVLSFSKDRVVVRMDYEYVKPTDSFYLVVEDNYVVVYLEDLTTVYMYTDILLSQLPEEIQQEIIQRMYVPDEETLYSFLEDYTS